MTHTTTRRAGKKCIALLTHMDTVAIGDRSQWKYNPEGALIGDLFYGRGSADAKGSIVSMLLAAEELNKCVLNGTLVLAFPLFGEVVSPKDRAKGLKSMVSDLDADFAIYGEPTNMEIKNRHPGRITFTIRTIGKRAHGAEPHKGINAILNMNKLIPKLMALKLPVHKELGNGTMNIAQISGGLNSNVVPDQCDLIVDRRTVIGEDADSIREEILKIIEEIKRNDPEFQSEIFFPLNKLSTCCGK